MSLSTNITFPSQPEVVEEKDFFGKYKIDGLYPGYGYTLGNSLRRIILSSLPGTAITLIKIDGVEHEFSAIDGVKEDVITILMRLKNVRFISSTDEPQSASLSVSGIGEVTAGDIKTPGQLDIVNEDLVLFSITDKSTEVHIEMEIESGLGYIGKEDYKNGKVSSGEIALDAAFSPIRLVNYEVEDMRVGDRTDFNRLEIAIETDGTITPREALETSILTMIRQLQAVIDIQEPVRGLEPEETEEDEEDEAGEESGDASGELAEFLKTRIENLDLPTRTTNALERASIRTAGGLAKKTRSDLLVVDGLGKKGVDEIEDMLADNNASLSDE
jgi:DNA-directed RNA polymerase subunit alpha